MPDHFVRAVHTARELAGLESIGLDRAALDPDGTLDPDVLADPEAYLPFATHCALWQRAESLAGPDVAVRVATKLPSQPSTLFYLINASRSVGDAFERMARHPGVVSTAMRMELDEEAEHVVVHRRYLVRRPHAAADFVAVVSTLNLRRALGGRGPTRIRLTRPAPPDPSLFEGPVGCPIDFGAAHVEQHIPREVWDLPLAESNPELVAMAEARAQALIAKLPRFDGVVDQVRRSVLSRLPDGAPGIDDVAAELAMSRRSLQRRLQDEGAVFQDVVERMRQDLASEYLREPRHSVADVAHLLGYSEASAFNRAFKRWTGKTPKQFRAG